MTVAAWVASDGTLLMLDGSTGVRVLRGAAGLDGPTRDNTIERRVGAAGGVLLQTIHPPRQISLPVTIDLGTMSAATVVNLFQNPGTLIATSGRELREVVYDSGLEGVWDVQHGGVDGLTHRHFPLELTALDPMWYGPAVTQDITIAAPTPWNYAGPWNAPIPWNGGASAGLVVAGDTGLTTFPRWTIHGEIDTLTVGTTDGTWQWVSTLDASSYGTVDHRPGTRGPRLGSTLNGVAESAFGQWGLVDESSSLDWGLRAGTMTVTVGATGTGASTALSLWYEPPYYTS